MCGQNQENVVTKPHPADNAPLSADAIGRGMESLKNMAATYRDKTIIRADDGIGCGSETVEVQAERLGREYRRRRQV